VSYPILDPAHPIPALKHLCALAVMAKAPRPGKVKTRLSPPLRLDQTAALNVRFLRDTTENLATIAGSAGLISYTPAGDEELFDGLLPATFALVLQRGDGFGERLLAAAQDILAIGYGAVCLIDSDSPTVPAAAFQQAVDELQKPGDRVVLGPSHDGGYYLIGLKQAHAAPFERITWSTATVLEETISRCREAALDVVLLPTWYDVDDAQTLAILEAEVLEGLRPAFASVDGYAAPHTRKLLLTLDYARQPAVQIA
jgi:rSAM/selenodomain-associated transferase 1